MVSNTQIIITPRLVLRPWQRRDLDVMARWPPFPDPIDAAWNWPRVLYEHGTLDLFWASRNFDARRIEWTITRHDDQIVGYINLREIDYEAHSGWLGIGFGYPYIGQGYGTEALRALLDHAFGELGLERVRLDVALYNTPAVRLYRRFGFRDVRSFWQQPELPADWRFFDAPRYDGIRHLFRHGQGGIYMRCVEMSLAADDWCARKSS
jgi:RimJ/RimL family protein N-acetyltransferase